MGTPWILNLGDHCEIPGNAVTPLSTIEHHSAAFDSALRVNGVFCAATHYWELQAPSVRANQPSVGDQLHRLIDRALAHKGVVWRSVGDVVTDVSQR